MMHSSAEVTAVIDNIPNGSTIMFGGFGLCGIPENLIKTLAASPVKDLVCISNNCGTDDYGLGLLLKLGKIRKIICCYVGNNRRLEKAIINREIDYEFVPSGTLVERCRAAGAGVPAFYTRVGVGTIVEEGKEIRYFEGKKYLLEKALKADYAFIKAAKGDTFRNLVFKNTEENFNPQMAMAANITIAEVEQLCAPGELKPNEIDLPGIFVQHICEGELYEGRIEKQYEQLRVLQNQTSLE